MALAMNDAYATPALLQAIGQESGEQGARLLAVESVQVDFSLNDPASAPQVAQDMAGKAGAQEGIGVANGQQIVDFERAV